MSLKIGEQYRQLGVKEYYQQHGSTYFNPHREEVLKCLAELWPRNSQSFVDFACGEGLVTKFILQEHPSFSCYGVDKFLAQRYMSETKKHAFDWSFEEVANFDKKLVPADTLVISYAIDLIEASYLDKFLYACSYAGFKYLLVIRPNAHIIESSYWTLERIARHGKAKGALYSNNL